MKSKFLVFLSLFFAIILFSKDCIVLGGNYFLTFELRKLYKNGEYLSEKSTEYIYEIAVKRVNELEDNLSLSVQNSDINRINNAKANEEVEVSKDTIEVLKICKEMYEKTSGAFNPAVYNLVDLWGFSPRFDGKYSEAREEPSEKDIKYFQQYLNFEDFIIDEINLKVKKPSSMMKLDLGGIAKGYVCDEIKKILEIEKVENGIISLMSNICLLGDKITNDGEKVSWKIGVTHPRKLNEDILKFKSNNCSVTTSGDYERYYIFNDKRYCHIIDSSTGKPADKGIASVTILSEKGSIGDAYATAIFSLGLEKGRKLLEENNINGIIITENEDINIIGNINLDEEIKPEKTDDWIIISIIIIGLGLLVVLYFVINKKNQEIK